MFKDAFDGFLIAYTTIFKFVYVATIFLIIVKRNWGALPEFLISCLAGFLDRFDDRLAFLRRGNDDVNDSESSNDIFLTPNIVKNSNYEHPFHTSTHLLSHGIQSILNDNLSRPFEPATGGINLLTLPRHHFLMILYYLGALIRWGFLLPLRIAIFLTALVFLPLSGLLCILMRADQSYIRYCGITFARMFNAATGLIINSYNRHNRPRMPGLAVANHLSANDVMTIYSDCDYNGNGYTITAQSHGGLVHFLEKFGSYLTPILLVNRACGTNRSALREAIVNHSRSAKGSAYPVLLFPEGYCTNNQSVLQFRKATFDGQVVVYPMALKQNARFGDSFWSEDTYLPYLIRIMTSWCLQIDIHYLEPMSMHAGETDYQFAERVQRAICSKAEIDAIPYDGKLKRVEERDKFREKISQAIADQLNS